MNMWCDLLVKERFSCRMQEIQKKAKYLRVEKSKVKADALDDDD